MSPANQLATRKYKRTGVQKTTEEIEARQLQLQRRGIHSRNHAAYLMTKELIVNTKASEMKIAGWYLRNKPSIPKYDHVHEYEQWLKTARKIKAALRGDPVAIAENHKEVERIRQREKEADE
jgi:hypothetical protein